MINVVKKVYPIKKSPILDQPKKVMYTFRFRPTDFYIQSIPFSFVKMSFSLFGYSFGMYGPVSVPINNHSWCHVYYFIFNYRQFPVDVVESKTKFPDNSAVVMNSNILILFLSWEILSIWWKGVDRSIQKGKIISLTL